MKRVVMTVTGLVAAVMASLALAGAANAANETATASVDIAPQKDSFYKGGPVPANLRIAVEVKAPFPASPRVLPLKNVKFKLPTDLSFHPDNAKTPVCPDDKVGPDANLAFPPDTIIDRCPKSVIGNGTAGLYLAKVNYASGPNLDDPVLVVFNGGRNSQGNAILKIYGYSAQTNYGVHMNGVLQDNGTLDVQVPILSYDSAVGNFDLNIPGTGNAVANRRGQDLNYAQAKCSTGSFVSDAELTLGEREPSVGPESVIQAPQYSQPCTGKEGPPPSQKAKFANLKIKGPKAVKKGKKATYKVTVKNIGKGAASKVVVKTKGGSAKVGSIAAGKAKTLKVKAKVTGKKGKKVTLKFTATAKGVAKKVGSVKVKVK